MSGPGQLSIALSVPSLRIAGQTPVIFIQVAGNCQETSVTAQLALTCILQRLFRCLVVDKNKSDQR